jgi:hypothetical protein
VENDFTRILGFFFFFNCNCQATLKSPKKRTEHNPQQLVQKKRKEGKDLCQELIINKRLICYLRTQ